MFWRLIHRSKIARYAHGDEPWALVTGASDGIGKGIAKELLKRGLNVILHGRSEAKLASVRASLLALHPTRQIDILILDAGSEHPAGAPAIYEAISAILHQGRRRLTVLVNNVGHTSAYERIWEQDPRDALDHILNICVRFATHITRACLPHLIRNQPGLIINVTGLTSAYPAPFLGVHSAAKAYIESFSRALSIELDLIQPREDVECIATDVHNVASNSNSSKVSFFTPSAEVEGQAIVDVVGCGKRVVTAYWRHELQRKLLTIVPDSVMDRTMAKEMTAMRSRELALNASKAKQEDASSPCKHAEEHGDGLSDTSATDVGSGKSSPAPPSAGERLSMQTAKTMRQTDSSATSATLHD